MFIITKDLSFFLSWVSKTQPKYQTMVMMEIVCCCLIDSVLYSVLPFFLFFFGLSFIVSVSFSFVEFINGVCGLRCMCCGGIVAYHVECTNVVKNWYEGDCVNLGYQGRRGWFFKLGCRLFTSIMFCDMTSVL